MILCFYISDKTSPVRLTVPDDFDLRGWLGTGQPDEFRLLTLADGEELWVNPSIYAFLATEPNPTPSADQFMP